MTSVAVETSAVADDDKFAIQHIAHVTLPSSATDKDQTAAESAVRNADKVCVVGNLAKKAGVTIDVEADIRLG